MLPFIKNQRSSHLLPTGSFHIQNQPGFGDISPSSMSQVSPFADVSPRNGLETSYFGYRLPSPTNIHGAGQPGHANFHFKRLRSDDSVSGSLDASPMATQTHVKKLPRSDDSTSKLKTEPARFATVVHDDVSSSISSEDLRNLPLLRFGEEGRAKLKSALSDAVRRDADVRARVDEIGKIRLASMQQLMRMAKVAGLWSYAEALVMEHDSLKQYRRSS